MRRLQLFSDPIYPTANVFSLAMVLSAILAVKAAHVNWLSWGVGK
jgi:hypothetical protein